MASDYHVPVIERQHLFGISPNGVQCDRIKVMEKAELFAHRRERLWTWIVKTYRGNVSAFAAACHMSQPQIADMLAGRRSFGEKVAAKIEKNAPGMPAGYLSAVEMTNREQQILLAYRGTDFDTQAIVERILKLPIETPTEAPAPKKNSIRKPRSTK